MSTKKKLSPAAEENAAILHAIMQTAVDVIVTINRFGIILHVNPAVERLFGYSPKELIGQNVSVLMASPDREQHDTYLNNYLRTRHAKIIGIGREVLGRHKLGYSIPVDLAVSEIEVQGQKMFTGILRDMSDRRQAEAALQRERTFAENLLDTANAIVLVLDGEGRISRMNRYLEQLVGYSTAQVLHGNWFDLFVPKEFHAEAWSLFRISMLGGPPPSTSIPIITPDGTHRVVAWAFCRLVNSDDVGDGLLAVGNDITELQQAEHKLIQQERLAAIGQMVTGLAHESRNALQRSRACLDVLELDCAENSEQLDLIRRTQQALVELQRLYDEVRGYAAPIKLERSTCDLAMLARETWDNLLPQHPRRRVSLVVDCASSKPVCNCDRHRIEQVFRNIFENALAVAPQNSGVQVSMEEQDYRSEPALRVTVLDEGPGLNAEQRQRIFEPFYTTKTRGTGLGMPIARRIIESHGGKICVSEHAGPGAEIEFYLPLH